MAEKQDHLLSNRVYDVTKFTAQIGLPAVGTLYFALAQIWGLPKGEEVVGSITAVVTFLGVLLGVSTTSYNNSEAQYDGAINVEQETPEAKTYSLNLKSDPDKLDQKKKVTFKVDTSGGVS